MFGFLEVAAGLALAVVALASLLLSWGALGEWLDRWGGDRWDLAASAGFLAVAALCGSGAAALLGLS